MMLVIKFSGWAMCRLPTDPDPYDEPRGVSGYMRAYAGEPDLDRIIRFQDPPFKRSHTPLIGVTVITVISDGETQPAHPLVGAKVDLLDQPVFEGRNGVIAEDTKEPIIPFHMALQKDNAWLSRSTVATNPRSPYREFNAINFAVDHPLISQATGIQSLVEVWESRLQKIEAELADADEAKRPGLEERLDFLRTNLANNGGVARFFAARMEWNYPLRSELQGSKDSVAVLLPDFSATDSPWLTQFWFGGWDADAQAFFVSGTIQIAASGSPRPAPLLRRPERMSDIIG